MNDAFLELNYKKILSLLPPSVQLVVVSKTQPSEKIQELYSLGHRAFGENKVQELLRKQAELPKDIKWHLIGHLQTNKVKNIAAFVDTVESVDSQKLLEEISKQALRAQRNIKVLLQVKIAEEESKFGLEVSETKELFQKWLQGNYPAVRITGLMGMATFTADLDKVRREFSFLKHLFDQLSRQSNLETLSMGMSGDFQTAIACGSTSVRVGSAIFGERDYH